MTVVVGTLNGVILLCMQTKVFCFHFKGLFRHFIHSWLNLDFRIETCYFPGMDTYIMSWLQLAFPAYVISIPCIFCDYQLQINQILKPTLKDGSTRNSGYVDIDLAILCQTYWGLLQVFIINSCTSWQQQCVTMAPWCNHIKFNIGLPVGSTFLYSLWVFFFSWFVWSSLLFSSCGSIFSVFQKGGFQVNKKVKDKNFHWIATTIYPTLPSIATELHCCGLFISSCTL